jgi:hypothetical protein
MYNTRHLFDGQAGILPNLSTCRKRQVVDSNCSSEWWNKRTTLNKHSYVSIMSCDIALIQLREMQPFLQFEHAGDRYQQINDFLVNLRP